MQITGPVLLFLSESNGGDVLLFKSSEDAVSYMELLDVQNNEYDIVMDTECEVYCICAKHQQIYLEHKNRKDRERYEDGLKNSTYVWVDKRDKEELETIRSTLMQNLQSFQS